MSTAVVNLWDDQQRGALHVVTWLLGTQHIFLRSDRTTRDREDLESISCDM